MPPAREMDVGVIMLAMVLMGEPLMALMDCPHVRARQGNKMETNGASYGKSAYSGGGPLTPSEIVSVIEPLASPLPDTLPRDKLSQSLGEETYTVYALHHPVARLVEARHVAGKENGGAAFTRERLRQGQEKPRDH
jgi:hypothetical protein